MKNRIKKAVLLVLIVAFCFTLQACSQTQIRLGAGHDFENDMKGQPLLGFIEVMQPVSESISCGWMHVSHIASGMPFNYKQEDTIDALTCFWTLPTLPGSK